MTELENIKLFFSKAVVKNCVSVKKIEEIAKLPTKSLYRYVKGEPYRFLTPDQIDKLIPVIIQIGYKPVNSEQQFI